MQRMTETPPSTAALVLRAMNCSVEVSWGVFTLGERWIVEVWENCGDAYLVALLKDDTALAVADDSPVDLGIAELLNADLTGESTVGLVVDVLGSNADVGVGELTGQSEVDGGR